MRIRPTAAGGIAILLVLGAGIVAVNSGNNLLYLLVSGLLAALALSGLLGHGNLRSVALRITPPEEAWAGRPVTVRAELLNRGRRWRAYLLTLALEPGAPLATVIQVPPGERAAVPVTLTFPGRGRRAWPVCAVTSEFPFGLVRRGATLRAPGACVVYPAPVPLPWDALERAEREGADQPLAAAGAGGDYRGLREYRPGDGLSRVQWSSWLRLRSFQTKEFDALGTPPVHFDFDAVPGPGLEDRLGQLAWLVRTSLRRGRSVGLKLPGLRIPAGTGAAHRRRLLAALALFDGSP